jgi:hypothetical protein
MSTYTSLKKLYKEIDKINAEIDARIKRGLSYKTLSRRHKLLVEELRSLQPQSIASVFPTFSLSSVFPKSFPRGLMNRLAQYVSVFLM